MDVYSGGTEVTVTGSNLDSIADPRINLTVVVTRVDDDVISKSPATSNSEVLFPNLRILKYRVAFSASTLLVERQEQHPACQIE